MVLTVYVLLLACVFCKVFNCSAFFRANFLLSNYNKCLDYLEKCRFHLAKARQSIKESILVNGYALLLEGKSKLCLGQYQEALNRLEKSIAIAHSQTDTELECLVCCAMGELYLSIRDFEKVCLIKLACLLYKNEFTF